MIAFDNGPADGDYVRYIEAMARAAATNAAAQLQSTSASNVGAAAAFDDTMMQARERQAATRRTTTTRAAAAAIARAAILQNAGPVGEGRLALVRALALALAGAGLVLFGFFMQPISMIVLVAGIAILVAGFRRTFSIAATLRAPTGQRNGSA